MNQEKTITGNRIYLQNPWYGKMKSTRETDIIEVSLDKQPWEHPEKSIQLEKHWPYALRRPGSARNQANKRKKNCPISEAVPWIVQIVRNESAVALAHSLLELIDTSACVYELLLTCVERVALRADINTEAALRGSCLESLAASALYGDNLCLRMDSFFHVFHLLNQRFGA